MKKVEEATDGKKESKKEAINILAREKILVAHIFSLILLMFSKPAYNFSGKKSL